MKITKTQLKQIIKEEFEDLLPHQRPEEGSVEYHIMDAINMLKG